MPKSQATLKYRRYTSLPVLINMLATSRITLVDPALWEDRNDAYFLEQYRKKKKLKTVLALCFTTGLESYHHWKVYAGNPGGVCVRFFADKLKACFNGSAGISMESVSYGHTQELKNHLPSRDQLPFLKRSQFKDEKEFRIIYEDRFERLQSIDFKLDLKSIYQVKLSPWLPPSSFESVKDVIRGFPECSSMDVRRSALLDYQEWKNIAERS
jgi:hypothetical protein